MKRMIKFFILLIAGLAVSSQTALSQDLWTPQNSGTSSTLYRVQFIDGDIGYAVGDGGTVIKTTDGGANWASVSVNTNYPVRDLSFIDGLTGWVATGDPNNSTISGSVWKTTDGGGTWEQQLLGTTQARLGISFVSTELGWACGANNGPWDIRATTNGGSSWFQQSGSGFGWIYDIDCISADMGWSVGVVYYPSSTGFVIKTTNGGTNWNQQNTGNIPFLYGIEFVDSDHGFTVGDEGTILGTTDGGSTWSDLESGTSANLTDQSFISSSTGWVCGEGGAVLMTTDGGSTWDSEETGINTALRGICFVDSVNGWTVGDGGVILKYSSEQSGNNDNDLSRPEHYITLGNFPNPFNAATTISYTLSEPSFVNISIFNLLGEHVATLANKEEAVGGHKVYWDASKYPSGIYYSRLKADGITKTTGMMLLK